MSSHWLELRDVSPDDGRAVEALVHLNASCPWFDGHFPAQPILPGVALLGLVSEAVRRAGLAQGRHLAVHSLSRVRFKALAYPGQELTMAMEAMPAASDAAVSFRFSRDGDIICQGLARVRESDGAWPEPITEATIVS